MICDAPMRIRQSRSGPEIFKAAERASYSASALAMGAVGPRAVPLLHGQDGFQLDDAEVAAGA